MTNKMNEEEKVTWWQTVIVVLFFIFIIWLVFDAIPYNVKLFTGQCYAEIPKTFNGMEYVGEQRSQHDKTVLIKYDNGDSIVLVDSRKFLVCK